MKLNKQQTNKVMKILSKQIGYNLQDQRRYKASSKFGDIMLAFDLNSEIPTIYCRYAEYSKVINKEKSIERGFGETSGKRNYHVFPKDIAILIDEFGYDVMMDKIKILEDLGVRL